MGSRPALLAFAPRPRLSAGAGSVRSSMPLGFSSGRPLTPLSVATSAFSPAITCRRASFSASSRSASASSSPRGRPERLTCFEADMAETSRVRAGPAQPRQLTSARPFAPRTFDLYLRHGADRVGATELKALTVSDDARGGYLVPSMVAASIIRVLKEFSPVRQLARVVQTSSDKLDYPTATSGPTAYWTGEVET